VEISIRSRVDSFVTVTATTGRARNTFRLVRITTEADYTNNNFNCETGVYTTVRVSKSRKDTT
jgi:hypothetical protein